MPTLSDVAAAMRDRFTPQDPAFPVTEAKITVEEWNVLASLLYLKDAAEALADAPARDVAAHIQSLKDEVGLLRDPAKAGDRAVIRALRAR